MPSWRAAVSFFANYFLLFVSFGILTPYLQLYLKARGFSPSRIGVLLGIIERTSSRRTDTWRSSSPLPLFPSGAS